MCGIVGYVGADQAAPILLEGLSKLEYRGYDSAGLCVQSENALQIIKSKGKLNILRGKCEDGKSLRGTVGIGHTRWATHGEASDVNSHPQASCDGSIVVVHNGIIENEAQLRSGLERDGVKFYSQTDTEVVANLIARYYARMGNFLCAVQKSVALLEGSYALGVLCRDKEGTLIGVKKDSPLVFGYSEKAQFIASDVSAIAKYAQNAVYLDDGEIVVFDGRDVNFYDKSGAVVSKASEKITVEDHPIELGKYPHYMIKEIFEQPMALRATIEPMIRNEKVSLNGVAFSEEDLRSLRKIYFVACGSAYYVATLAKYLIEQTCGIATEAVAASEFRYGAMVVDEKSLVVAISQSGETADTLAAVREAKRKGAKTLAIVNVKGSSIAKCSDQVLYTRAGTETSVATTKAFSAQLAAVYLLNLFLSEVKGCLSKDAYAEQVDALRRLPDQIENMLNSSLIEQCSNLAKLYYERQDAYFLGRNLDWAICMEGSLKLKEVAYVHSEAYPAGEMKHGPISMIEKGTLVVALATVDALFHKTLANIREVKSRGAEVICITMDQWAEEVAKNVDHLITLPASHPLFRSSASVIPMQLFSYYVALARGCEVDKPRNLAKSVTVE